MQQRVFWRVIPMVLAMICASSAMLIHASAATPAPRQLRVQMRPHTVITVSVSVRGVQPWTDSSISVGAGVSVTVKASGIVNFGTGNYAGPDGIPTANTDPTFVAPNLTAYALMARIGSGLPFVIGTGRTFVTRTAGELTLGPNDSYFGDNSGDWSATVTVRS